MKPESNYMAQLYGLQHRIGAMLLPDEHLSIHDTSVRDEFVLMLRGPKYGANITVKRVDLMRQEDLLVWIKREIEKVRADWRKEGK